MRISVRNIVVAGALSAVAILLGATRLGFIPFVLGVSITIMHVPVIIGAVLEGPVVGTIIGLLFGLFSLIWSFTAAGGDVYFQNPLISVVPRLFIGLFAYLVYRALREPQGWKAAIILGAVVLVAVGGLFVALATPVLGGYEELLQQEPGTILPTWKIIVLASAIPLALLALVGLYLALRRRGEIAAIGAAAVAGTLTNTVLVLGAIYLAGVLGWVPPLPAGVLVAIGLTNGIPEIVAAVLITVAVVAAWKQIEFGRRGARILRNP
jgi:uncharacterized membrane protein